jgi:hypothetical protein
MIDREGRDLLASKLRAYMREDILSGELEEVIDSFFESLDQTLAYISLDKGEWFHLDLDECRSTLTKAEWSRLNQVLLLLESDAEIECDEIKRLTWRQPVAWIAIGVGLVFWAALGMKFLTGGYFLPFMAVALLYRAHFYLSDDRFFYPFPSLVSLAMVRRRLPSFKREVFPGLVTSSKHNSGFVGQVLGALFLWPLMLIAGAVPQVNRNYRLSVSGKIVDCV